MQRQATNHFSQLVGRNLRAARLEKGFTQHELAQLANTQAPFVSRWESGLHRPKDEMLAALGAALGKDIAWFFSEHEKAAA